MYKIIIDDHRPMHQKYVNSRKLNSFTYMTGNYNQVRQQVKSDKNVGNRREKLPFGGNKEWNLENTPAGYKLRTPREVGPKKS